VRVVYEDASIITPARHQGIILAQEHSLLYVSLNVALAHTPLQQPARPTRKHVPPWWPLLLLLLAVSPSAVAGAAATC
jgi:hypothetical protein